MTPAEKKLEKLQKLLEIANEDYATPDDLIALSEGLLSVITTQKAQLDKVIADEKAEDIKEKQDIVRLLNEKEKSLKYLISELGRAYSDDNAITSAKFAKEVKRLEKKIPSKVDLTEIYADIESLKNGITNFVTEITKNGYAVRDSLELIDKEEDKLSIDAIGYLREILNKLEAAQGVKGSKYSDGIGLVVRQLVAGSNITIDDSNQEYPIISSTGGGGGSVTVTTPTGSVNGTNVTFTSATVAKWIDTDTGHYYPNKGYTRSGTTYTMDLAPNDYIYLIS